MRIATRATSKGKVLRQRARRQFQRTRPHPGVSLHLREPEECEVRARSVENPAVQIGFEIAVTPL